MTDARPDPAAATMILPTPEATTALAESLGKQLGPGDVILIEGPIGAGKSHFARSLIQARLRAAGRIEDVPSPTYTLVQVYEVDGTEIWHADLYRLTAPEEVAELGLDEAFETAICLVEWPDRLGDYRPGSALTLRLSPLPEGETRRACLSASGPRWAPVLARLALAKADRHG
ncbi:tRNA (adenosine(37)-N6)-threonylcarbamoyltransferase complex ATPase subunit type 1 TsaE [Defluviimonas sp. WL0024]|uniref:tRNA threonylcarbamoyladenosine biosynthesis protein TsaE n=2 Tax=Albidovulum TaxID=205889 RepID=A0ABT3J1F3_9RHOB|nr:MULTISPECIES: tRNA (adenosine(37)-N6)-threonylcarbamoyltransferase complex ATPase subunit type 1 TsaE [Defluviimonas]MCU9848058.1 tRNA (adenosine(37)-N6)-threonylcarbamoyltransferase complex ATPase subunit type 1 TsaE [Defluviimonas sp. WL0024]MCW3781512.1 tRNA (adenosine(37)-N6)-threonylcarbamoyltransferase complex ATPase subunit type 1 TsaE [Defluviimonas salinarum]